ncbi:hypothetical protein GGF46_004862 [Coemansia sp. RSA 552]|nr:hypothetical protein GGF46_004862 [Coemansia sp. RSA 552]
MSASPEEAPVDGAGPLVDSPAAAEGKVQHTEEAEGAARGKSEPVGIPAAAEATNGSLEAASAAEGAEKSSAEGADKSLATAEDAERDREIVEEFEYLLEKSQQLFAGLSDLPEIGSKYWLPHFQRTFEVYTKLWRFQTQHRVLLEKPEHYGLKRWEVGEIASKIGQLYYRYYLRTSETNYLQEAFVFYDAIRERNYFRGEQEMRNSALMIKKLRYYARFIVVCLQMNSRSMMFQLLDEVKGLIDVYATTFNPVDKMEWALVAKEMALFMQAVCAPVPQDEDSGEMLPVSYRLVPRWRQRAVAKGAARFRLQEAIVVGNRPTQIKFSELTLDMYYVLQMLEREPSVRDMTSTTATPTTTATDAPSTAASAAVLPVSSGVPEGARSPEQSEPMTAATEPLQSEVARPESAEKDRPKERPDGDGDAERERGVRRTNPHKHMLYQPSISQIQVYLANAFREVGDQGCVLLYLSSEGTAPAELTEGPAQQHGFIGGIATARRGAASSNSGEGSQGRGVDQLIHAVHPADLVPFTRKPLFLVVESDSSAAYRNMPNLFSQPLLCLLSPSVYPELDTNTRSGSAGSLYTFFLHSPIVAFCTVSHITSVASTRWAELEQRVAELEELILDEVVGQVPASVAKFLADDFLRQMVVRHVLCCVVLGIHCRFTRPEHLPQSSPDIFSGMGRHPQLVRKARGLAQLCDVTTLYRMGEESEDGSQPRRSPPQPPAEPPAEPTDQSPPQPVAEEDRT